MTDATDIIVTTGLIAAGVGTLIGFVLHLGKQSPTRSSGGGRRTLRMRRSNNGTRRA
jgi:hypothetical protein